MKKSFKISKGVKQINNLTILGIETSCDDTCIAILKIENCKLKILSNVVSSQVKIHRKWGGVYPSLAKREHQKNLPIILNKVLKKAGFLNPKSQILDPKQIPNSKFKIPNLDLIAVTVGPGLEPCLWQGVNFAIELAKKWKLKIVPVNHIEAHILANWLSPLHENLKSEIRNPKQIKFPAVCLVVSGGHSQLILMKKIGQYKILGETRDDAAGECLDKVARILGLGYPGGPAIAQQAEHWKSQIRNSKFQTNSKFQIQNSKLKIKLPRPMIHQKNYDFSFSGLKTAVLYDFKKKSPKVRESKKYIREMAKEVQQAIIEVLIKKTIKAAKDYQAKTIILGGGVAANDELRKQFKKACLTYDVKHFGVPKKIFCTDNAAMVAVAGYFHRKEAKGRTPTHSPSSLSFRGKGGAPNIEANANLRLE